MRELRILTVLAPIVLGIAAPLISTPALADDPNDPEMASSAARARDRAIIRKLNEDQLAYVRERDARYAQGWDDYRRASSDRDGEAYADDPTPRKRRGAPRDDDGYASANSEYQAAMAEWREDVAACRAGYYEHCAR
ncbi:hypothetical protein [Novosphingobium sp.]|uniref:hypothetical protein n=1 Tax=Novosphingobium sp. TaxID=1874826 RepID=UPI002B462CE4|nr:hypothetical protein [Novosphingobium sp.]HKR92487.1 hypothetical protein [Novosphingobium sp.]